MFRRNMSKSDNALIVFATLLMVAICVSYFMRRTGSPFGDTGETAVLVRGPPEVVRIADDADYDSWRPPRLPRNLRDADQTDPELADHIRDSWVLPPPTAAMRRLKHPEKYDHSEFGQSFVVDKLLKTPGVGFYVDVYAGDGETNSNSLFMEKDRDWSGLLVEPNPAKFAVLVGKRRRAYMLNACVSPGKTPSTLNVTYTDEEDEEQSIIAQCFPLTAILSALRIDHVQYMSLQTDGTESQILETLPLGDGGLQVDMITARTLVFNNRRQSARNMDAVREVLGDAGYRLIDAGERINRHGVVAKWDPEGADTEAV